MHKNKALTIFLRDKKNPNKSHIHQCKETPDFTNDCNCKKIKVEWIEFVEHDISFLSIAEIVEQRFFLKQLLDRLFDENGNVKPGREKKIKAIRCHEPVYGKLRSQ